MARAITLSHLRNRWFVASYHLLARLKSSLVAVALVLLMATVTASAAPDREEDAPDLALATRLSNQADQHYEAGRYAKAEPLYRRALGIAQAIGNPELFWQVQYGYAKLMRATQRPDAAIFFGKQAVNTLQGLRGNVARSVKDTQTGIRTSMQDAYKDLAVWLMEAGRLPEAQQAIDLLKEYEYFEYVRHDSGVADTPAPPAAPNPPAAQTMLVEGSKPATPTPSSAPLPAPAPTYHALLIGIGEYPALDERFQLKDGPGNDVKLMRTVLQNKGFGPERITVLADGVDGAAGLPTRAAILDGLTALSERVKPGDFAVVYYSGHGSQQPVTEQTAANEPDGLDETLLPRDVGKWNNSAGIVENAIVDDEIGDRLTALRQRGAFVLALFDSCHSATVTRKAPPEDWRDRGIEPENLGIPAAALNKVTARGSGGASVKESASAFSTSGPANAGGYVAFFGAQSNETAPQMRLPQGQPGRETHGLLTYTLASALAQLPDGASYRQVGEQVARQYVADHFNSPTPAFEGDRLDAPVFGQTPGERVQQWPLKRNDAQLSIPAGRLHGLAEEALLVVVAGPVASEPLGYLKITSLDLMNSQLTPTQPKDTQKPAIDPTQIPPGAYARLLSSPTRLTLRVAPPLEESQLPPKTSYMAAERQARTTLLEALTKAGAQTEGLRIELTQPTDNAEVVLRLQDGNLWLLDPGAELVTDGPRKSPSIAVTNTGALAGIVETHLQPLAKALSLLRLTAQLGEAASALQLEVKLWRKAQGAADFQEIEAKPGVEPTFNPGDKLKVTFKNGGKAPLDVTVLFIDSRYGITAIYPKGGALNRLLPRDSDKIEGDINTDTTGRERMLIIATRAETGMPASNFTYLAQAGVPETVKEGPKEPATRGSTRGAALAFEDTLLRAVFGQNAVAQRGFSSDTPTNETVILKGLQWQVATPTKPASPTN